MSWVNDNCDSRADVNLDDKEKRSMTLSRLSIVVVGAVMATGLVSVATACARLPLFLPGTAGNTFTATSGESVLEATGYTIVCKAHTARGEITGPMTVGSLVVTFTGCTSNVPGSTTVCTLKGTDPGGQGEGEIKTLTLQGALGLILQSAGVPLTPGSDGALVVEPSRGIVFVSLGAGVGTAPCTPATKITGSIAGVGEPAGTGPTTKGTFILSKASAGGQGIKKVDLLGKKVEPELVAFSETATETNTDVTTFASAVEVM